MANCRFAPLRAQGLDLCIVVVGDEFKDEVEKGFGPLWEELEAKVARRHCSANAGMILLLESSTQNGLRIHDMSWDWLFEVADIEDLKDLAVCNARFVDPRRFEYA